MPCVPIFDPPWVPQNTGSVQDPITEDQSVSLSPVVIMHSVHLLITGLLYCYVLLLTEIMFYIENIRQPDFIIFTVLLITFESVHSM